MRKMPRIIENVIHPINTLQKIYRYHRDQDVRGVGTKRDHADRRTARNWLSEYFESMALNRVEVYAQYKEMDQDPLVSAVLDTCATAAAQPNNDGSAAAGCSAWVESNNPDVKMILTKFLRDIRLDEYIFPILRSLDGLGDHYEGLIATRNDGIVRLDAYDPWEIGVLKDALGRVAGYGEADARGEVVSADSVMPYYRMAHFKMPFRSRTSVYGYRSARFYNARDYWVEMQWCMDKVWIERQQRRGPRNLVTMDVGGIATEEAYEACKMWEDRLYRDVYFNPQDGILKSGSNAWGEQRDVVLPLGSDNKTQIQSMPASGTIGSLEDLDFFMRRFFGSGKFPPGYLGIDLGDSYDKGTPIEKQDLTFTQSCMRLQQALLSELTRICMVHLAFLGLDPTRDDSRFVIMMTPVSTFAEIERKELLAMRWDLMERALEMGTNLEWNKKVWDRHVMIEYGGFSSSFVDELLQKDESLATLNPDEGEFEEAREPHLQKLSEELKRNPRARAALLFFKDGGSQRASGTVPFNLDESAKDQALAYSPEMPRFSNSSFNDVLQERFQKKAKARAARLVLNV